jgi:hypothetical protein
MAVRTLCLSALFFLAPTLSSAQDCKIKFAVVYNDGEKLQIGLSPEQKKMWDHDAPKKFKACERTIKIPTTSFFCGAKVLAAQN